MPKAKKLARKQKISKKKVVTKKLKLHSHSLRNKLIGLAFLGLALAILFLPQLLIKKPVVNKNPIQISSSLYASKNMVNDPVRILIPKADIDIKVIGRQNSRRLLAVIGQYRFVWTGQRTSRNKKQHHYFCPCQSWIIL